METKFKTGDLVQLKSGGPIMTINKFMHPPLAKGQFENLECVWFDATSAGPHFAHFAESTLVLAQIDFTEEASANHYLQSLSGDPS
ncbi:hypothetical protein GCM10028805_63960 [Spirosoma harenae]